MRRFGFIAVACIVAVAFVPASALARHHHGRHHARHHHKHHSRAHVKRFGSSSSSTTSSGETAGTVQSFSNGVLTIMLNDGSTVSGRVTSRTELECQAPEANEVNETNEANETSHSDGDRNGGEGGDEQEGNHACSTANLTPGTMVKEAELRISSSGKTWEKVELIS
jgi:hypothetical protein